MIQNITIYHFKVCIMHIGVLYTPFSAPTILGNYDIKMSFIKYYKLTVYVDMKDWNCYGYIEILAAFFHMKIKTSAIFLLLILIHILTGSGVW
jgi:hypothetical protein